MRKHLTLLLSVFFGDMLVIYLLIETINRTLWLFPKINYQSLAIAIGLSILGTIILYFWLKKNDSLF